MKFNSTRDEYTKLPTYTPVAPHYPAYSDNDSVTEADGTIYTTNTFPGAPPTHYTESIASLHRKQSRRKLFKVFTGLFVFLMGVAMLHYAFSVINEPKEVDGGRHGHRHGHDHDHDHSHRDRYVVEKPLIPDPPARPQSETDVDLGDFFDLDSTRRQHIHANTSGLTAYLDLYDFLAVTASSGSLDLSIKPHPAAEGSSTPAVLRIRSASGDVRVRYPTEGRNKALHREYDTYIHSASGAVSGDLMLGSHTRLHSSSSSINAVLTPARFVFPDMPASLHTSTASSSQEITIPEPLGSSSSAADWILQSTHHSASGSIVLRYPATWEGSIEASSGSGSVKVHDDTRRAVVTTTTRGTWVGRRGDGKSVLSVQNGSGNIDIYFG